MSGGTELNEPAAGDQVPGGGPRVDLGDVHPADVAEAEQIMREAEPSWET